MRQFIKYFIWRTSKSQESRIKTKAALLESNFLFLASCFLPLFSCGQSFTFDLKTTPNIDFTFNTIDKYKTGIIIPHALELKVVAVGGQWDLYMGATVTSSGYWNIISSYSTTGVSPPPVNILQARIYDIKNTEETGPGFFSLTDIAMPTYIVGTAAHDTIHNCNDASPIGTNQPGSYTSDPGCYRYNVDLKVNPGFIYRPGLYTLRVDFIIIEDL
jgi:hypothetical protein